MGLCDQSSAAALFRELPGEFVRRGHDDGEIHVWLSAGGGYSYQTVTTIRALETFERVEQVIYRWKGKRKTRIEETDFPWNRIFVSGYGAGTRTSGSADFQHYLPVDAVYPLFRYDVPLQNPELVVRRLVDTAEGSTRDAKLGRGRAKQVLHEIKELLGALLDLDKRSSVELTSTGIVVKGRWGTAELGELGDGYKATITWVLDLLAWWFLHTVAKNRSWRLTDVEGVVLIDELEQHLHPRWQRLIFGLLDSSFPQVQFIGTTHSPLVASGCEEIDVFKLSNGTAQLSRPYGWTAEDVYRLMGLRTTRARGFSKTLDELTELEVLRYKDQITKEQRLKLRTLRKLVDQRLPKDDPSRVTREIENMWKSIREMNED